MIEGVLLLCLVLAGTTACNSLGGGDKDETSQQLVKVIRGDLAVSVTGSGNIEASREARLSFGSGGKVDKIYVKEGDKVRKGDVLAKLDTSALELSLTRSQVALTEKQLALTKAQLAQQTAEYNLKNTLDTKDTLELALFNAQIDTKNAKYNVEKTRDLYTWSDIKIAQADVDEAERYVEDTLQKLYEYLPIIEEEDGGEVYPEIEDDFLKSEGYEVWQDRLIHAQSSLNAAKDTLEAMLSGRDVEEVAIKKLQLQAAEMAETQAQKNLDELTEDITIKELEVESAKASVEHAQQSAILAQQSLEEAQKDLDEATITAPFDGAVASVNAEEGDTIITTTTIVHLIDPSSMELIVELDEIDVPEVKLNQEVIIEIDALPDVEFGGRVTSIYPLPIMEGGVVLYNIKINFDVAEDSNLKIGMSADADIVINKRSNILLVPDRAIGKDDQGNPVVKVMVDEQTEERPVVIGISDGFETEIVEGLNGGETVVVGR